MMVPTLPILPLLLMTVAHLSSAEKATPPNIVFFLADDLGWNDLSYHGSEVNTPNIDKLAGSGVKLENYYVQPMCTPSRAALLSGRYPIHLGLQHEVIYAGQRSALPKEVKTLAEELNDSGYASHMIGKWHLGFYEERYMPLQISNSHPKHQTLTTNQVYELTSFEQAGHRQWCTMFCYGRGDYGADKTYFYRLSWPPASSGNIRSASVQASNYRGFKSWLGYLGGNEKYYTHVNCEQLGCGYDFRDGNDLDLQDNETYSTDLFTDRAKRIIDNHNTSQPLFLYMPFQAVHFPLEAPQEYIDMYSYIGDEKRRVFAAMATCMDDSIGNITDLLKMRGMYDNTIIVFSTDNGGDPSFAGNNWPLRGRKWTLWEGGIHGVAFVHSPLLAPERAGTTHRELMHISDWYPTIVEGILGQPIPEKLDGVNMWPSIANGSKGTRTEILHNIDPLDPHPGDALYNNTFPTNATAAIRVGEWKLITGAPGDGHWYPPPSDKRAYRHEKWLLKFLQKKMWIAKATQFDLLSYDVNYHQPLNENGTADYVIDETKNVWLFNVINDPEEIVDQSDKHPEIVKQLLDRLAQYNKTAVPPIFPGIDPTASPALQNGTWGPWVNNDYTDTQTQQLGVASGRWLELNPVALENPSPDFQRRNQDLQGSNQAIYMEADNDSD